MLPHNPLEIRTTLSQDLRRYRGTLIALTLVALAVHLVLSYAWPLFAIRSIGTATINYYVNLVFFDRPVDYHLIAYREPLAPLLHGMTLSLGVPVNTTVQVILALFAVVFVFLIAVPWGRAAGLCAALLYLADLPVQLQFHSINTEGLSTWFLILTLVILRYTLQTTSLRMWALFGFAIGLSGLTRPANLGFILLGAALFLTRSPIRQKLRWAGAAVGVMLLTITPWVVYKGLRYNLWEFSHEITDPFFRLAFDAGLIRPENGPASQHLVDLIEEHLLSDLIYVDHGVTLPQFLRLNQEEGARRHVYAANAYNQDITYLVDQYEGWSSSYSLLRRAAVEAFSANPGAYLDAFANSSRDVAFSYQDVWPFVPATFDVFVRRPGQMPPIYRESISHPNNVPAPTDASLLARANIIWKIMSPLENVDRHPKLAGAIISGWEIVWPPLAAIYVLAVIGLAWNRRISLALPAAG